MFGWGYGADLGGLSEQPGAGALTYPFKSMDDRVTFDRQVTGSRTFDYSTEGVAHYGLYADWFADLRRLGGETLRNDLWDGAEAYLEMWERASGVRTGCTRSQVALGPIVDIRRSAASASRSARDGDWIWCVRGGGKTSPSSAATGAWRSSAARRAAVRGGCASRAAGERLRTRVRGRAAYVGAARARDRGGSRGERAARMKRVLAHARRRRLRFVPSASAARFAGASAGGDRLGVV